MKWKPKDRLQPLKQEPISRQQLVKYAHASGDMNPIHLDEGFAKQAGFPSVIVHGMLSMAYLADYLRMNFPEGDFELNRLKSRFRKVTFPGDVLTCEGEIKRIDENVLVVSLWACNQAGEVTIDGEATLKIKS